ncbi:MAG: hypothetical protein KI792_10890 [Alphaproteobacteria bacterium]|nr:hypothetical protein [Alphaproteobacteria bacterium SS10]
MQQPKCRFGLHLGIVSALFMAMVTPAHAAPAQAHEECAVTGVVQDVSVRTVERDKEWAKSWGIAGSIDYVDVTMAVSESVEQGAGGINNCADKLGDHTFQLREGSAWYFRLRNDGKCLKAMSQVSGDEFGIGDYLYDIEVLEDDACGTVGN